MYATALPLGWNMRAVEYRTQGYSRKSRISIEERSFVGQFVDHMCPIKH